MSALRLLGLPGSLRPGSFNRALLQAAATLLPDGVELELLDLADFPLYDGSLDNDEDRPEPVNRIKSRIAAADGLLIATPEYNFGIPGVVKNALDWVSRPGFKSPMAGLPVGLMGASPGGLGTARAQEQLKLTLLAMLSRVFPHPGVLVGKCGSKFDSDLHLTDEATRDFLGDYLSGFSEWARLGGD